VEEHFKIKGITPQDDEVDYLLSYAPYVVRDVLKNSTYKYLNAKANEFAAAKCNEMFVEQELDLKERRMFTEEQVREAISKAFDAGDSHAETGGRSADLKETTDFIINQIKQK
jgi:hypothetical protein